MRLSFSVAFPLIVDPFPLISDLNRFAGLIFFISSLKRLYEFGIIGILPQVAEHYKITIDKAGLLLSAFALVIALTGPFMTLITSGFDRKKIMLVAIFMFLITGAVSSFSPPFWLLMLVRILPAFLQPVYIATALVAIQNKFLQAQ